MMLLHLVKKDILLIKKEVYIMMLVVIALPLFVAWRVPVLTGFASFLLIVVYTELILYLSVSQQESKYPRAAALISAAPYPRSTFVKAKYAFFLLVFVYCCIAYGLMGLIVPTAGRLDLFTVLVVFLLSAIIFGIYTPVQFRLGPEKTKFAVMVILFGLSFGLPWLYRVFGQVDITFLTAVPPFIQYILLFAAAAAVLGASLTASIRIYERKEL